MAKHFVLNATAFARQVRFWIAGRQLRDLSLETGISASALSRISNGDKPSVDTFLTLCAAMNVDPFIFGVWLEANDEATP